MSEHALVWEFDRDTVNCKAVCNAAPDADCRLSCYGDCEVFSQIIRHSDETFDGETVHRITHDDCDAGMRADECNVCLFLNESDCIQEMAVGGYPNGPRFIIGTVPIRPSWDGDCYEWEPVAYRIGTRVAVRRAGARMVRTGARRVVTGRL